MPVAMGDYVYIDDVELTGCFNNNTKVIDEEYISTLETTEEPVEEQRILTSDIKLYPNPSAYLSNLEVISSKESDAQIQLLSAGGQLMKTIPHKLNQGLNKVELEYF